MNEIENVVGEVVEVVEVVSELVQYNIPRDIAEKMARHDLPRCYEALEFGKYAMMYDRTNDPSRAMISRVLGADAPSSIPSSINEA